MRKVNRRVDQCGQADRKGYGRHDAAAVTKQNIKKYYVLLTLVTAGRNTTQQPVTHRNVTKRHRT